MGPLSLSKLHGHHRHISCMSVPFPNPRQGAPPQSHFVRRWLAVVDWLGAQKPIEIILGMVAIIGAIAFLAHLVR